VTLSNYNRKFKRLCWPKPEHRRNTSLSTCDRSYHGCQPTYGRHSLHRGKSNYSRRSYTALTLNQPHKIAALQRHYSLAKIWDKFDVHWKCNYQ